MNSNYSRPDKPTEQIDICSVSLDFLAGVLNISSTEYELALANTLVGMIIAILNPIEEEAIIVNLIKDFCPNLDY